jgi:predicted transcriptional regulator
MRRHLAIFDPEAIQEILKGHKTIESRFSQKKIAPFGEVESGDWVYIKPPGKEVVGRFKVKKVHSFEKLDKEDWDLIKRSYGPRLTLGSRRLDKQFLDGHLNAKYGTIIFIDSVEQFITSPIKISKSDLRGWMVLGELS